MTENNAACILNLIIKKFAKIFLIHLALFRVNNRCKAVKLDIMAVDFADCRNYVAKLAYARWLDDNAVGLVFFKHLNKCLSEISDKTATDTT